MFLRSNLRNKNSKNIKTIVHNNLKNIDNLNTTLNVLSEKFKFNINFSHLKKFKKLKSIVIIGMGGSILGAEAIYHSFKEKINKDFYFFDDLEWSQIKNLKEKINIDKTLFIIISKSGNTIETITNFLFLIDFKKNSKNIIIISEKKDSVLYSLTKKFDLFYIEHKNNIGGRYSVLSEVGMVPAYFMGLDIKKIRKNLKKYLKINEVSTLKNNSLILANMLNQKKKNNLIFLNYVPKLEKFLFWCQQLMAESLGKKGKGFLPLISNVPKDHHSLLQLYLEGPKDKFFYIFSLEEKIERKLNTKKLTNKINFLNHKDLNSIKKAQKKALIKVFDEKNIPYREFKLKKINESVIGELFSYFILETITVANLTNINPYTQPAVEKVKEYTKNFLR